MSHRRPVHRRLFAVATLALAAGCGRHAPPPSASAATLVVSDGTLQPTFDPRVTDYSVSLPFAVTALAVAAEVGEPGAAVSVQDRPVASGRPSAPVVLQPGTTQIAVCVTDPTGRHRRTYRVRALREPGLAGLATSSGALAPAFDPEVLDYELAVVQASFELRPDLRHPGVRLAVDGVPAVPTDPIAVTVGDGERSVELTLTAPDGTTARSYRVRVRRALPPWFHAVYAKAGNTGRGDGFGTALAVDGGTVVVGAPYEDSAGPPSDNSRADAGAAYVFEVDATGTWHQTGYLKAPNADSWDWFGASVAVSGDVIAVGACNESSSASGVDGPMFDNRLARSGAVYVFVRDGAGGWRFDAYLKAFRSGDSDLFGTCVAVSGDRIAVGAPAEDGSARGVGGDWCDDGAIDAGAAYLYRRVGGVWMPEAYVKATDTAAGDAFATALALDGESLAVGAVGRAAGAGAVYLYGTLGQQWTALAAVEAGNAGAGDGFGAAIALHGGRLAVAAPGEDGGIGGIALGGAPPDDSSAPDAGAVYVFSLDAVGAARAEAFVKAPQPAAGAAFGAAVALHGGVLAVGVPHDGGGGSGVDPDAGAAALPDSGAVHLFLATAEGLLHRHVVKASAPDAGDGMGRAVAIGGGLVMVGAPGEASAATGIGGDQEDDSKPGSGAAYGLTDRR